MVQALTQVPRALGIPEIIKEIFSYYAPQTISGASAQRGDTATILACALCCKAFSEIALDTLWYEMVDLVPLISILPGIKLLDNNLFINGELHDATCSRFWSYSCRIRRLLIPLRKSTEQAIHISVYSRLSMRFPGRAILPSLESLNYTLTDKEDTAKYASEFPILLSASVRQLRIYNRASEKMCEAILSFLFDKASQFRHLTINGPPPYYFFNHSLRLTSLRTLVLLKCQETFPDLAHFFKQLPDLQNLTVWVTLEWIPSPDDTIIPTNLLPNLRFLSVQGPEESCLLFLQEISGKKLVRQRINFDEITTKRGRACLTHLSRFPSLRKIVLRYNSVEATSVEALSILNPLLDLSHIQDLALRTLPSWVKITNDTIRGIASGLKNLQTLHISYKHHPKAFKTTSHALESIGLFSLNLRELTLPIDLADLTKWSIPRSSCAPSLVSLDLVTSSGDQVLIRQFVAALFPNVKKLSIKCT
ncbi:uncharacterized protein LACBIDRAFT_321377 [Laccaria bicolor S238N-H82]|uniref:Predicted protein n=1 Tax=Laccaria bicolor (strain S238N-H82 / ATCC MYA-4686) TaxID=486041 RepID=B0CPZ7_LACBS|nr:uncharacterized protein LACBIDRAFT_321377 [Laccaria bicolor S238N-H82]EDR16152.1 predicted protein [Laccaria bicolor S238N-H82]|eukprot:XP_001874360.1 predicted protein [Laccaria bicolor S238N-H82]